MLPRRFGQKARGQMRSPAEISDINNIIQEKSSVFDKKMKNTLKLYGFGYCSHPSRTLALKESLRVAVRLCATETGA